MTLRSPLILCVGLLLGLFTGRATADTSAPAPRHTPTSSTSTSSSSTTSSEPTVVQRTAPTPPASVSRRGETTPATQGGGRLRSTSYCLTGRMASGRNTYVGAVAANRFRLGTKLTVTPNPWGNPAMIFTVEDRHKPGATELDFAMPGECSRAFRWGNRQHVTVRVIG